MLENAEIFGSVLSGECGSVGGGWRRLAVQNKCPQSPSVGSATPKNPPQKVEVKVYAGKNQRAISTPPTSQSPTEI
jgi:hypothetical protein